MRAGPPVWESLSKASADGEDSPPVMVGPRSFTSPRGREIRLVADRHGYWLETTLARSDWTDTGAGVWSAAVEIRNAGRPPSGAPEQHLATAARVFEQTTPDMIRRRSEPEAGFFALSDGVVQLVLSAAEVPPAEAALRVYAGAKRSHSGRVSGQRYSGDGLSLWPGERALRSVNVSPGSALRFATSIEPALYSKRRGDRPVVFRVRLDGEILFERTADGAVATTRWHTVQLPASGGREAVLSFEVAGHLAHASFIAPTIGPREVGEYGARPWSGERPNIVLFVADTFRADNLAAYGDERELTPYLNELALGGLLFRRAWSVGTSTLPAHVSMFSGVYPHQAGIVGTGRALPDELVTIAELLAKNGYRTGAITDSVIVSQQYGLDQGFEWFDEHHRTIGSTARRVDSFLEADDGRPVFLFVQSYRTHLPYEVSDHVRHDYGDSLGIDDAEFWNLETERVRLARRDGAVSRIASERGAVHSQLRGLYRGAAMDLDHGFQAIHQNLENRGILDEGYLVFTSDHGEGLEEHGTFYHTGKVWEEQARIPLFIVGPGLEPQTVDHAASLVDLAPTLAEIAGLVGEEVWLGRSLLSLDVDRPTYVFECKRGGRATVAVIEGSRKIIAPEDAAALRAGKLFAAFDLRADPAESHNLLRESGVAWPDELIDRLGITVARLLDPIVGPEAAQLSEDTREQLRSMGYLVY